MPAGNRRLAQWRVTWLIEHSTSHQLLWCIKIKEVYQNIFDRLFYLLFSCIVASAFFFFCKKFDCDFDEQSIPYPVGQGRYLFKIL